QSPPDIKVEDSVEVCFSGCADRDFEFADARVGIKNVEMALLRSYDVVQTIKIGQVAAVTLYAGDVASNRFHGPVEFFLTTAGYEDIRTFSHEQFGGCQTYAGCTASDNDNLSVQLFHIWEYLFSVACPAIGSIFQATSGRCTKTIRRITGQMYY